MADPELSTDDTRPHSRRSHLNDLQPDVVGQGAAVDEDPAQLVHSALALEDDIFKYIALTSRAIDVS